MSADERFTVIALLLAAAICLYLANWGVSQEDGFTKRCLDAGGVPHMAKYVPKRCLDPAAFIEIGD